MEEGGVWQLRMGRRKLVDGAICGRRGSMATQNGAQKVGRRSYMWKKGEYGNSEWGAESW